MGTTRTSYRSTHRRGAFTILELLIVIGIIAVLLSILIPVLATARDHAHTTTCLANLREIGAACVAYSADNDGIVIPEDVRDFTNPSGTFGYNVAESWATILIARKYVPYPFYSKNMPPVTSDVFRCPGGGSEYVATSGIADTLPLSRTDGFGGMGTETISKILMPGRVVYNWYGVNGSSGAASWAPLKRMPPDGAPANRFVVTRMAAIKKPQHLVFAYDGMAMNMMFVNANRLNARHNRQRITNILFFDGHAESLLTANLPGGAGNANPPSTTFSLANLAKYPHPMWRLDQ